MLYNQQYVYDTTAGRRKILALLLKPGNYEPSLPPKTRVWSTRLLVFLVQFTGSNKPVPGR